MIKKVLELKDTGLEGLEHVKRQISEGKFDETIPLFADLVQAFATIEQSLANLPDKTISTEMNKAAENVRAGLDHVATAFENRDRDKVFAVLQFSLVPKYKQWMEKLDKTLQPYILS